MKTFAIALLSLISLGVFAQQKISLKYNLENGTTYRLKSVQVQTQTRTMQGMEQSSETTTTSVLSITPINQSDDFFVAKVKFDTMNVSNTMPPMSIESKNEGSFDSGDPIAAITEIIHRLSNSELAVKLSYTGKVIELMNYESIAENIMQGIEQLQGQAKMVVEMQGKAMVSKDMLTGMIEASLNYLPGADVAVNDTWNNSLSISPGGMGMNIATSYKLVSLSKDQAVIHGESIVKPASNEPVEMNGALITNKMEGMGKLNFTLDTNTGFIESGHSESQMSGIMEVNSRGNVMEIPVESISEITIEKL